MKNPTVLTTGSGTRFGVLNDLPGRPAPTIFVFAVDLEYTLTSDYGGVGHLLIDHGFMVVSLDVPGHGADEMPNQPNALLTWRDRLERGQNPIADFTAKVSDVLDYLIEHNYTEPALVAVSGTSRGGFMASHVAAADTRFRWFAPLAPATDLLQITEFQGMANEAAVEGLSLIHLAPKLTDRSMWLTIGNNDNRVNTDSAIAFSRAIVGAAAVNGSEADVELHVVAEAGHVTPKGAHGQAAAWLLDRMGRDDRTKATGLMPGD